ncbi:VWA domain-containing protein [Blastococcus sp. TF02-09]|uniref:substrate-binding domain-containing protein n=1 Tax=Blastococcus sp. TF02-09 TaxID=2250576 RepID=UPI000DE9C6A7|nr:substrate-binding domain-containing protein [Blastococcus sp. TF02-9]RBY74476.1 VWA domain-containing protein [Blastococcus sp. TF02-9]
MGRHADSSATRRRFPAAPLIAAGVVVVLLAAGLVWWLAAGGDDDAAACGDPSTVAVTVAPELVPLTEQLLSEPGALGDDGCVTAEVTDQEPLQTAGALSALDAGSLPDVWVPDSSLWALRAGDTELTDEGTLGSSPVVLATSRAVAEAEGWTDEPPTWAQALTTDRDVAVPDLAGSAEGIAALATLRTSLGGDEDADNGVVEVVLSAARAGSSEDALEAAGSGAEDAALVPVSEQTVYAAHASDADSSLVAVYPSEGSPVLDYPVFRVAAGDGQQQQAVDAVVAALTSEQARNAAMEAGFRSPEGDAPPAAGEESGIREEAPQQVELDPAEVGGLLARLTSLAAPSRILAVLDVSASMEAPAGNGTRATLARDAAQTTLSLVPGEYALGLWFFAYQLVGDRDWTELVPIRKLDAEVDGQTQRQILDAQAATLPQQLTPGGTGLYDTTLAAVRASRANYDPSAVNSVLLMTDGTNEDDDRGISQEDLLRTLTAEADPTRPVKVIGVALGPDADLSALEQIAEATGGAAYSAVDPTDLQAVLFDALRQRE